MAWIELTAARLAAKTGELSIVKGILLPDGQTADGIIAEELAATVKRVRGYCPPSCPRGDGETIPDELEDAALALVRLKVFERIEALKTLLSDARVQAGKDAIAELVRWSNGNFKVEPPSAVAPVQAAGPMVEVCARPFRASSRQLDGM